MSADPTATVTDEWIETDDGYNLFTKTWTPSGTPVAHVVMIHGFGEHVARYDHVFQLFAQHGILVYGYDQRGFGESGKKSTLFGDNGGYDTALNDVNNAVKRIHKEGTPLFLLGHSMGGGIILNYLCRKEKFDGVKLLTGAIASAPLVTLSASVPAYKFYPLKILSYVTPNYVTSIDLDPKFMSHDDDQVKKYVEDPLIHGFATLSTVRGFLDAGKSLLTLGSKIDTPILFSHGTADPVNSYEGTKKVYEIAASKDKTFKSWDGLFHELHNEKLPERDQVAQEYLAWIQKRIPAQ